jgi:hypothetical protein
MLQPFLLVKHINIIEEFQNDCEKEDGYVPPLQKGMAYEPLIRTRCDEHRLKKEWGEIHADDKESRDVNRIFIQTSPLTVDHYPRGDLRRMTVRFKNDDNDEKGNGGIGRYGSDIFAKCF